MFLLLCFFFFGSISFPTLGLVNYIRVLVNFGVFIVIDEVCENNGPKIVVRSIKRIKKGEEVTVAYTDLLQPKVFFSSISWPTFLDTIEFECMK